jgi:hypothetical protein
MICGGVPGNQKVAEGWIKSKLNDKDDIIRAMVFETMVERGIEEMDDAAALVDANMHVNGFKSNGDGLYIEGRQIKAGIKEAALIAVSSGNLNGRGWGKTNKGLRSFVAEHVVVVEDKIPLGATEPSGVQQRFIHKVTKSGAVSAIHYEEYVEGATLDFTVRTDYDFSERDWAMIWLTAEQQGVGASRSQGFGRYEVTRWEKRTTS